jgi:serine/threonine protein kinase
MQAAAHTPHRHSEGSPHPLGRVRVRRLSTGTEVRSTVLHPSICAEPRGSTAHEEAAARTRELDCDRIVQVVSVGPFDTDRLAFDAELVSGRPVAALLHDGPMQPALATSILIQTAHALAVAHEAGLLHGALSTSSVLVELRSGTDAIARVTDWGIGALSWDSHQRTPEIVPMSPERVLGLDRSPAEDVYQFGCLAYTMLTGLPLFAPGSVEEIRRRHAIEDPPPMSQSGQSAIPPSLYRLVERCLAKEPEDRLACGTSLLIALREAMAEDEIETPYDAIGLPDYEEPSRPPPRTARPPPQTTAAADTPREKAEPLRRRPPPPPRPPSAPASASEAVAASPSELAAQPSVEITIDPPSDLAGEPTAEPLLEPALTAPTAPGRRLVGGGKPRRQRGLLLASLGCAALVGIGAAWVVLQPDDPRPEQPSVAALHDEPTASVHPDPIAETREEAGSVESGGVPIPPREASDDAPDDAPTSIDDAPSSVVDAAPSLDDVGSGAPDQAEPLDPTASPSKSASNRPPDDEATAAVPDVDELLREARQAQGRGDSKRADELFRRVLEQRPRNLAALEGLSGLAFNRGDHAAAAGYLKRAVKISPRDAELRIRLGDAHFKLRQYPKARREFEKAAQLGHPSAARRLARVESETSN